MCAWVTEWGVWPLRNRICTQSRSLQMRQKSSHEGQAPHVKSTQHMNEFNLTCLFFSICQTTLVISIRYSLVSIDMIVLITLLGINTFSSTYRFRNWTAPDITSESSFFLMCFIVLLGHLKSLFSMCVTSELLRIVSIPSKHLKRIQTYSIIELIRRLDFVWSKCNNSKKYRIVEPTSTLSINHSFLLTHDNEKESYSQGALITIKCLILSMNGKRLSEPSCRCDAIGQGNKALHLSLP